MTSTVSTTFDGREKWGLRQSIGSANGPMPTKSITSNAQRGSGGATILATVIRLAIVRLDLASGHDSMRFSQAP